MLFNVLRTTFSKADRIMTYTFSAGQRFEGVSQCGKNGPDGPECEWRGEGLYVVPMTVKHITILSTFILNMNRIR